MIKSNFWHIIVLTLILGSGCSKNDQTNVAGDHPASHSQSSVNNDPDAKFIAQQTTINSFESSNTYNNYGFPIVMKAEVVMGKNIFINLFKSL